MRGAASRQSSTPWGSVAALLSACFAALVGVVRGIDPEVILWRAAVSATLVGAITTVVVCVVQRSRRTS